MIPRTTQPMTDATEPLTLIEKLELEKECWHDDGENNVHRIIDDCIDIVKQHSEWVPCSERMPNDGENVLFHSIHSRTVSLGCRNKYAREYLWDIADSCGYELDRNISHWQPLPQPPSEVQDD